MSTWTTGQLNGPPTHEPAAAAGTYESRAKGTMVSMTEDSIRWAIRCHGHRGDGSPCKRWAIRGAFVCPSHGGRAPQVRAAARRRLLEIAAYRTLGAWSRSPAYRERAELAGDRAALEAFAARLAS